MNFCLPKYASEKFIDKLKSGKINPEKLSNMESKEREDFFADIVGKDNAEAVNRLFESKLLLKNQQRGFIEWAKETARLDGWDAAREKRIIDRIEKLDRLFNPSEEEVFLNQLADEKLNLGVTEAESKTIYELAKKIADAKGERLSTLQQIKDTLKNLDEIDTSKLTQEQKTALASVKDKLQQLHDARDAEKLKEKQIKDDAKEKLRVAREASRAKEKEQKAKLREQAKAEKMAAKEEAKRIKAIERETARQLKAEEARIRKEQVAAEREYARQLKAQDRAQLKDALGKSMRQLKNVFGDQLPTEVQKQVSEIVSAKVDIEGGRDRMEYGRARVEFDNYIRKLKEDANKRTLKEIANDSYHHPIDALIELGGQAKSAKASLDNSAIFRQGWKTMFTNPGIWMKNAVKSFSDIANTLRGKEALDETKADIISRENYPLMKKGGLAVGTKEEAFPGSFMSKVPGLARLYKASEQAYTAFVYRLRADLFDKYVELAKQSGVDLNAEGNVEGMAKVINSLTGRGHLGRAEKGAELVNNLFFSPRFVKSHFDTYLLHPLGAEVGRGTFAQKMAVKNMAKIVVGNALMLGIIHAIDKDAVELDPRSSDFGKVKIGDTRFDLSGGAASVATLAARILADSSKSSSTGEINSLSSGKFGATTKFQVMIDFMAGKASPIASVFIDYGKGKDRSGKPVTVGGEISNLLIPLPITNAYELYNDPNSANMLATIIADGLGISTNTYAPGTNGVISDKANVLDEALQKRASGDVEGAKALVKDYNDKLRKTIEKEMVDKDPTISPEDLQTKSDTKFEKNKLDVPSESQANRYSVSGHDVVEKILADGKPVIAKDTELHVGGIIGAVVTYAHAIGIDPETAFNRIFTMQKITEVRNGTVIVNRMSLEDSTSVKEKRGGNNATMKLDHTLPLELGGSNSEDNLKLVTTAEWKTYTPVEDYLGKALKEGKVDKKTAQDLIAKFKNKEVSFSDIKQQTKDVSASN